MQIFTLVTGVIYIVLEVRQKNFMWVVGILTSLAAMWVFFRQGLYASFCLNLYYLITSFIGLWQWGRMHGKRAETDVPGDDVIYLNPLTWRTAIVSLTVFVAGTVALSFSMKWLHTAGILAENPMSLLDAAVAVLSAIATWWLVRCYLQQWWLWIVADSLSVALCLSQNMWWMAALYLAYVVAAVYGLRYWKKHSRPLTE